MKRLILMRHAKTESDNPGGDKARRLLPRGVQEAQEAGVALAELGVDYALVSSAVRTRETFAALGLKAPVEYQDALYYSDPELVLQRISETDESVSSLLVLGHSPTMPALTARLAYASDRAAADQAQCWFPTATYSVFSIAGSWLDLDPDVETGVRLEQIVRRG